MQQLSDQEIVKALIDKDEEVTQEFFFVWCRPLIYSRIRSIFPGNPDYNELINELYAYLLENDGYRLRTFKGKSSIYVWLKCVATRFFIEKRDGCSLIDETANEPLYTIDDPSFEPMEKEIIAHDVRRLLSLMRNSRYRLVLQRLLLEDVAYEDLAEEMNVSVSNLYNIKKRALESLTAIALKEYENGNA